LWCSSIFVCLRWGCSELGCTYLRWFRFEAFWSQWQLQLSTAAVFVCVVRYSVDRLPWDGVQDSCTTHSGQAWLNRPWIDYALWPSLRSVSLPLFSSIQSTMFFRKFRSKFCVQMQCALEPRTFKLLFVYIIYHNFFPDYCWSTGWVDRWSSRRCALYVCDFWQSSPHSGIDMRFMSTFNILCFRNLMRFWLKHRLSGPMCSVRMQILRPLRIPVWAWGHQGLIYHIISFWIWHDSCWRTGETDRFVLFVCKFGW
jgi:hypothetical protein